MKPTKYKTVMLAQPAAIVDNASFTTLALDTKGFAFAEIFVAIGALDIAVAALKVQESDATSDANTLSSGTDVVGTRFGTDANDTGATSTLPSATDDNKLYKFEIDLKGRKRYLDVTLTGGDGAAGTYAVVWAHLHEGDNVPTSAADKGVAQLMRAPVIS